MRKANKGRRNWPSPHHRFSNLFFVIFPLFFYRNPQKVSTKQRILKKDWRDCSDCKSPRKGKLSETGDSPKININFEGPKTCSHKNCDWKTTFIHLSPNQCRNYIRGGLGSTPLSPAAIRTCKKKACKVGRRGYEKRSATRFRHNEEILQGVQKRLDFIFPAKALASWSFALLLTSRNATPLDVEDSAENAARAGMFGKLTRSRAEWRPDKIICKRFNVPDPFFGRATAQTQTKTDVTASNARSKIFGSSTAAAASFVPLPLSVVPAPPPSHTCHRRYSRFG